MEASGDEVHGLARRQLKIVRLLEPELCFDCRFAHMADVESEDGSMKRMIYCKRLDCDNWDFSSSETAKSVKIQEEDEAA